MIYRIDRDRLGSSSDEHDFHEEDPSDEEEATTDSSDVEEDEIDDDEIYDELAVGYYGTDESEGNTNESESDESGSDSDDEEVVNNANQPPFQHEVNNVYRPTRIEEIDVSNVPIWERRSIMSHPARRRLAIRIAARHGIIIPETF